MSVRKLVTEDGEIYTGTGFGAELRDGISLPFELVFNTSSVGYQEILTDPSYTDQGVVFAWPLVGNYGINRYDGESGRVSPSAAIVREATAEPSNFRSERTLSGVLIRSGVPGISGIDTRRLVRSIRDRGSRRAVLADAGIPAEECVRLVRETPARHDQVKRVSPKAVSVVPAEGEERLTLAAVDCGMKENIVRSLCRLGCRVIRVPYDASAKEILNFRPDGVLFSNGPGDPEDVPETVKTAQELLGQLPVFGICLGHQVLALASGAKTYKMKFGHRGGNHPVKNLLTGKIGITSQNHSYAVDLSSIPGTGLSVTHVNLLDGTAEGLACPEKSMVSVQFHPESAPGPEDSTALFDEFIRMTEAFHAEKK